MTLSQRSRDQLARQRRELSALRRTVRAQRRMLRDGGQLAHILAFEYNQILFALCNWVRLSMEWGKIEENDRELVERTCRRLGRLAGRLTRRALAFKEKVAKSSP